MGAAPAIAPTITLAIHAKSVRIEYIIIYSNMTWFFSHIKSTDTNWL